MHPHSAAVQRRSQETYKQILAAALVVADGAVGAAPLVSGVVALVLRERAAAPVHVLVRLLAATLARVGLCALKGQGARGTDGRTCV